MAVILNFPIHITEEGTGSPELHAILDCREMTSSTEVYNAYTDLVSISNDGAYASFEPLTNNVYNKVTAIYLQNLAGVSFRTSGTSNVGFYFNTKVNNTTAHLMIKTIHYVSGWINPKINIHFIQADSLNEVPSKITAKSYAWSKSLTIANTSNTIGAWFEAEDAPVGNYYIFFDVPDATGGNEALFNYIGLMNL